MATRAARVGFVCAVALALVVAPVAGACEFAEVHPTPQTLIASTFALHCLINEERARHSLPALRLDRNLTIASVLHSREMVLTGYLAHISPDGRNVVHRARAAGYLKRTRSWELGENIAWGTGVLASPGATMRGWLASPTHRANLLRRGWREVGIGISFGPSGVTYTADFGTRRRSR